jgi:hypothetical protein
MARLLFFFFGGGFPAAKQKKRGGRAKPLLKKKCKAVSHFVDLHSANKQATQSFTMVMLTQEQMEVIRERFTAFDKDMSGEIDVSSSVSSSSRADIRAILSAGLGTQSNI